jgi:gliding motility-associated-like protein
VNGLAGGLYTLSVADDFGCRVDTSFTIPVLGTDATTFIPNVFSPNGDGVNDTWLINGACLQRLDCTIFNRWGTRVADLRAPGVEWDGTVDGVEAPDGVYAHVVSARRPDGSAVTFRGHITLLR